MTKFVLVVAAAIAAAGCAPVSFFAKANADSPIVKEVRVLYEQNGESLGERTLAADAENPSGARTLAEKGLESVIAKVRATMRNVAAGERRYEIRYFEPDGDLAAQKGIDISVAGGFAVAETVHNISPAYIAARPGFWRLEFFVDGIKIGERVIRVR